jgi:hypothetical protein
VESVQRGGHLLPHPIAIRLLLLLVPTTTLLPTIPTSATHVHPISAAAAATTTHMHPIILRVHSPTAYWGCSTGLALAVPSTSRWCHHHHPPLPTHRLLLPGPLPTHRLHRRGLLHPVPSP